MGRRSRCDRRQIGAVIVDANNRPIATGYNGPPSQYPTPDGSTCRRFCQRAGEDTNDAAYTSCISIHAEANALLFADRREYVGGTIYVTSVPCWDCGKLIANSGLKRVVTFYDHVRDAHRLPERTIEMIKQCGIEVIEL